MSDKYPKLPVVEDIEYLKNNGVVIVDKPSGPTSHQVAAWARDIVGTSKAGHAGTLDPKVTGVLPIAFGPSARALHYLHLSSKEYVGVMRLHHKVSRDDVLEIFSQFTGPIFQMPPVRAAVKRQRRVRNIFELELLEMEEEKILFKVSCESGTYIRTLCFDIGEVLGVGGHMVELRRTRVGHLLESDSVTLQMLSDSLYFSKEEGGKTPLMPMESLLLHLPRIILKDNAVDTVCHGAQLNVPGIELIEKDFKSQDVVLLCTKDARAVAAGRARASSETLENLKKGEAATLETVFMEPGTYPK
ncbi:MAG TPA: RNA-guided pseudouridylation complex pseudouridine synthase subunit Cbf5 [Euryarchaeota archaeon]|nr:RNA-guided pseudouridylation complex pseudouridine synthase subunit Cbf5 [Euryarchaeota archaeon]